MLIDEKSLVLIELISVSNVSKNIAVTPESRFYAFTHLS
jgi:hypothetical protein